MTKSLAESLSSAHFKFYPASQSGLCVYLSYQYAHDLFQLIFIPDASLNVFKILTISSTSFLIPRITKDESSAYCEMHCYFLPPNNNTLIILSYVTVSLTICENASPTIRKRRKRATLTHPLSMLKVYPGLSLRFTVNVAFLKKGLDPPNVLFTNAHHAHSMKKKSPRYLVVENQILKTWLVIL